MFEKGHKGMGGRPKKRSTIIKEFAKNHPMAVDALMEMLYNLALDKSDKDAAQYIIDRIKGRPHQSIEQTIKGQVTITPAQLVLQVLAIRGNVEQLTEGTGETTETETA